VADTVRGAHRVGYEHGLDTDPPLRRAPPDLARPPSPLHAGAGTQENPLDSADIEKGDAGFARVRAGINRRLSLDATVLRANSQDYASAGVALNLGRAGVWSGHLAQSNGAAPARLRFEGTRRTNRSSTTMEPE
jgi:outer membrane usher protein FimD/PapC